MRYNYVFKRNIMLQYSVLNINSTTMNTFINSVQQLHMHSRHYHKHNIRTN